MRYEAEPAVPYIASRNLTPHESPETRDIVFNKHSVQDGNHVSPSNNGMLQVGLDGIQVRMIKGIDTQSFKRVVSYGLRATTGVSFDEDAEEDEDTDEMLRGGLQQALEADTLSFAVTGVSRACTHQLVRSRKASFLQQSQRATFFGNNPEIRIAESVWNNPRAREAALLAAEAARNAYMVATEENVSYQDARLMLPEGTTNSIICTYTVREWLNTLAYRGCYLFQWEISHVFREMRRLVVEAHPWLEAHAKITCEKTGKCEFTGWEQTEAQCALPMAREDNRRVKSKRYEIGSDRPTPLALFRAMRPEVENNGLQPLMIRVDTALLNRAVVLAGYTAVQAVEALGKAVHAGEVVLNNEEYFWV